MSHFLSESIVGRHCEQTDFDMVQLTPWTTEFRQQILPLRSLSGLVLSVAEVVETSGKELRGMLG